MAFSLSLVGLFHSYINLTNFDPSTSRTAIERLVHLFCIIPRHQLIHNHLLSHYPSDDGLYHHLLLSDASLHIAKSLATPSSSSPARTVLGREPCLVVSGRFRQLSYHAGHGTKSWVGP
ncbi:hypothetical protein J5N97_004054 [Dioscorea zingiberensis]|uniref:Uncharacterized protein n=1 Tax=Dioscorea zingiberensis TaxID=325984 RepID=A0A9D5HR20_9LILI|nr:hypothetical protein J5N97_004054 [Dioscorea zingiberensis]